MFAEIKNAVTQFIDNKIEEAALYFFDNKGKVLAADALISTAAAVAGFGSWALWAHILLLQNWSFTYVSRARNSGSLTRHLYAGTLSNGVWWLSQIIIFSKLYQFISGAHGIKAALLTGLFYTAFTLTGSISAHAQALRNEKGKTAVGASKKYAQIPAEDWAYFQSLLTYARRLQGSDAYPPLPLFLNGSVPGVADSFIDEFRHVSETASNAYALASNMVPDSGMAATKIAGEIVLTGIETRNA